MRYVLDRATSTYVPAYWSRTIYYTSFVTYAPQRSSMFGDGIERDSGEGRAHPMLVLTRDVQGWLPTDPEVAVAAESLPRLHFRTSSVRFFRRCSVATMEPGCKGNRLSTPPGLEQSKFRLLTPRPGAETMRTRLDPEPPNTNGNALPTACGNAATRVACAIGPSALKVDVVSAPVLLAKV